MKQVEIRPVKQEKHQFVGELVWWEATLPLMVESLPRWQQRIHPVKQEKCQLINGRVGVVESLSTLDGGVTPTLAVTHSFSTSNFLF